MDIQIEGAGEKEYFLEEGVVTNQRDIHPDDSQKIAFTFARSYNYLF